MSKEPTATVNEVNSTVQNMAGLSQKSSEHDDAIASSIDEAVQGMEQVSATAQNQAEVAHRSLMKWYKNLKLYKFLQNIQNIVDA